ncbi:MAG: hypothetical protein ACYTBJ_01820 [Planctomycetota bacterium]|jgi:hypothetical protein
MQTIENLRVNALTQEQHARTCDYWYTVTRDCGPHTAFRTREALFSWLRTLGLTISGELPEQRGEHASLKIDGKYRRGMVNCEREAWESVPGIPVTVMSNGDYTTGKLTVESDGTRCLTVPNPNCHWRTVHDHKTCRMLQDQGVSVL